MTVSLSVVKAQISIDKPDLLIPHFSTTSAIVRAGHMLPEKLLSHYHKGTRPGALVVKPKLRCLLWENLNESYM